MGRLAEHHLIVICPSQTHRLLERDVGFGNERRFWNEGIAAGRWSLGGRGKGSPLPLPYYDYARVRTLSPAN